MRKLLILEAGGSKSQPSVREISRLFLNPRGLGVAEAFTTSRSNQKTDNTARIEVSQDAPRQNPHAPWVSIRSA